MSNWEEETEERRRVRYQCPNCQKTNYFEIERKMIKDKDAYRHYYREYLIFVCRECNNIYGVEI